MVARDLEENRTYWNGRAALFAKGSCSRGTYVDGFMSRLGLAEGWSVFDMGCGPGTLALPFARDGREVLACDFSQNMLDELDRRAQDEGLRVSTKLLAWEDDWESAGVKPKSFDAAVASRSIKKSCLPEMLEKLESVAREVVGVTVPATPAPFVDFRLLEHLGRPVPANRIDQELVGVVASWGRYPNLSYLKGQRGPSFDSHEGLLDDVSHLVGNEPLSQGEEAKVERYVAEHEVAEETESGTRYRMDYSLEIAWGLVVWRPDGKPLYENMGQ